MKPFIRPYCTSLRSSMPSECGLYLVQMSRIVVPAKKKPMEFFLNRAELSLNLANSGNLKITDGVFTLADTDTDTDTDKKWVQLQYVELFRLEDTDTDTDTNGLQIHFVGVGVGICVGVGQCEHSTKHELG